MHTGLLMANLILLLAASYALPGLAFGVMFVFRGLDRVDASAHGAPWLVRTMILPGAITLWPLMARLWLRAVRGEAQT
ncbi:hypothetical protein RAS1_32920 [Phycisphaerae bacterium RAS1]|nr:hypothetical protein RAS1_32920 [Phycisphaerae bacterium RAS1]